MLAVWTGLAAALPAQSTVHLASEARLYKEPSSTPLGTLAAGAEVIPGRRDKGQVEVTVEGWIISSSLGSFTREGFDVAVSRRPQENLRQAPNGAVVARMITGAAFNQLETKGGWTHVRRTAWIAERALPTDAAPAPSSDRLETSRQTPLAPAPGASAMGGLDSGAAVRAMAKAGGWTRIQLEAWVPDSLLRPLAQGVLTGITAAEVRANPTRFVGQVLEWRVQFVAVQRADELRPEIPAGAPYLLTRGPLPEPGFVYVIVPPADVSRFEALPALREIVVRGTLRAATSKFLPTPVLELIEVVEGMSP